MGFLGLERLMDFLGWGYIKKMVERQKKIEADYAEMQEACKPENVEAWREWSKGVSQEELKQKIYEIMNNQCSLFPPKKEDPIFTVKVIVYCGNCQAYKSIICPMHFSVFLLRVSDHVLGPCDNCGYTDWCIRMENDMFYYLQTEEEGKKHDQ